MSEPQRRMRIALVTDTINSSAGGAIISGQRFVNRLREHHDVLIISTDPHGAGIKLKGFQPKFCSAMKHGNFILAVPDRKAIHEAFQHIDIVHLQLPFWLSFVALDEARKAGIPVVASFHVQPENILRNIGVYWPWLNRKLYQFWVQRLWNYANLVICPTQFAETKLQQFQLRAPTMVISNGVPASASQTTPHKPKEDGFFHILMVGRLAAEKRQDLLIEAIKRSKYAQKIKLVIAGMGSHEKKLRDLATSLPNGAEIGFLSNEDKNQMLASADLFVHCSEVELEGMAVLEAMHAGLPVLVADGPETAASGFALPEFRFPVGAADILAAKLDWLIEHPDILKQSGIHCRAAANKLNIEKSITTIEEIYYNLLK